MLFQTSFGIPAEGVYAGLVALLLAIIAIQMVVIILMARRNIRLVDDNRKLASDAITGLKDVISALNTISRDFTSVLNLVREQVQIGDNSIMSKIDDSAKRIHEKMVEIQREVSSHLLYLRDKSK